MNRKKPLYKDVIEFLLKSIITCTLFFGALTYLVFFVYRENCKSETGYSLFYFNIFIMFVFSVWCFGIELIRGAVTEFIKFKQGALARIKKPD